VSTADPLLEALAAAVASQLGARLDRIEQRLEHLASALPRDPITITEAARRFGVSSRTVRRWVADGTLPAIRGGGRTVRIDPSALVGESVAELAGVARLRAVGGGSR